MTGLVGAVLTLMVGAALLLFTGFAVLLIVLFILWLVTGLASGTSQSSGAMTPAPASAQVAE